MSLHKKMIDMGVKGACPLGLPPPLGERGGHPRNSTEHVVGRISTEQKIGVAADNNASRENARKLLANTKIKDITKHPLLNDDLYKFIAKSIDSAQYEKIKDWTMGKMKTFLLTKTESEIKAVMFGMNSEVVGCLPKLMSNQELIAVDKKIFNPLPGTKIGAKGYLSARIQPNSPTDDPEEIVWQVFEGILLRCRRSGDWDQPGGRDKRKHGKSRGSPQGCCR